MTNAQEPEEESEALREKLAQQYAEILRKSRIAKRRDHNVSASTHSIANNVILSLLQSDAAKRLGLEELQKVIEKAIWNDLKDRGRRRKAKKRSGVLVELGDFIAGPEMNEDLEREVYEAIQRIGKDRPRVAKAAMLRHLAGHTIAEIALILGVSETIAKKDLKVAQALLALELKDWKPGE